MKSDEVTSELAIQISTSMFPVPMQQNKLNWLVAIRVKAHEAGQS